MTLGVVDLFEPVEVQEQQGTCVVAPAQVTQRALCAGAVDWSAPPRVPVAAWDWRTVRSGRQSAGDHLESPGVLHLVDHLLSLRASDATPRASAAHGIFRGRQSRRCPAHMRHVCLLPIDGRETRARVDQGNLQTLVGRCVAC